MNYQFLKQLMHVRVMYWQLALSLCLLAVCWFNAPWWSMAVVLLFCLGLLGGLVGSIEDHLYQKRRVVGIVTLIGTVLIFRFYPVHTFSGWNVGFLCGAFVLGLSILAIVYNHIRVLSKQ